MNSLILLKLQLKRYIKLIPSIFLGAAILSVFAVIVVFCAAKLNQTSENVEKKSIVFSSKDKSPLTAMIVSTLASSDSINVLFDIKELPESDAIQSVKNGNSVAAIVIPKNFMKSIISGDNYSIDIYFSDESSLYSLVLTEMSLAAQNSLKAAQSAIYTEANYYSSIDMYQKEQAATDALNTELITDALSRGKIFKKHIINSSSGIDLITAYICSAISVILLLLGCIYIIRIKNTNHIISVKLNQNGIGAARQVLTDTIAIFLTYVLTLLIIGGVVCLASTLGFLNFHPYYRNTLLCFCVVVLFVTQMILLSAQLFQDSQSSILFLFVFTIAATFLSGGFIPSDLLPIVITKIALFVPTTYMIKLISHTFTSQLVASEFGYLMIFTIVAFAMNLLLKRNSVSDRYQRRVK